MDHVNGLDRPLQGFLLRQTTRAPVVRQIILRDEVFGDGIAL